MPDLWAQLTDGFMPHGYCLRWDGPLLSVLILGNVGIACAYFLIPAALRYFIGKRTDLPYAYMFRLFAAFILSCGLTHVVKVWTLYQPVYWIEALLDLFTAGVSLLTAALLFPLLPQALQLRSPKELEAANQKLLDQIAETERAEIRATRAQKDAEIARDLAIKANNLKTEFVANISHEIRTPLSGIIGMAELLNENSSTAEVPELSQAIFASSQRLHAVLNSLLDFSKLEAGKVSLDCVTFSPRNMVEEVIALIKPVAQKMKITLDMAMDHNFPDTAYGDEAKIRQILVNFVHNAVKFTSEGSVNVSAIVDSDSDDYVELRLLVTDTGIGINNTVQAQLFRPFVQADGSTSRRFGGTGLGLAIAKQYVELMNGQIGIKSEEGKGSTFWFSIKLPKSKKVENAELLKNLKSETKTEIEIKIENVQKSV